MDVKWPASSSCLDFPSFGQMSPFLAKLFVFGVFLLWQQQQNQSMRYLQLQVALCRWGGTNYIFPMVLSSTHSFGSINKVPPSSVLHCHWLISSKLMRTVRSLLLKTANNPLHEKSSGIRYAFEEPTARLYSDKLFCSHASLTNMQNAFFSIVFSLIHSSTQQLLEPVTLVLD